MPRLELKTRLSPNALPDLCCAEAAVRRDDGVCAVISNAWWPSGLQCAGFPVNVQQVVCIYAPGLTGRLAVFDEFVRNINEVVLHPTEPWALIATGEYDGGMYFEGDLWLLNWQTQARCRVLAGSRDVRRVRCLEDGRLAVLLNPREDWEGDCHYGGFVDDLRSVVPSEGAWHDLSLPVDSFPKVELQALGFDADELNEVDKAASLVDVFGPGAIRRAVLDVAWLDDDQVIAVLERCAAEVWDCRTGALLWSEPAAATNHAQLLQHGMSTFVWVPRESYGLPNQLLKVEGQSLRPVADVADLKSQRLSMDRAGRVLCAVARYLDWSVREEWNVVDTRGGVTPILLKGDYDLANVEPVCSNGADALYFLKKRHYVSATPSPLCRVDLQGNVHEVGPWQGTAADEDASGLPVVWTALGGWVTSSARGPRGVDTPCLQRLDAAGHEIWLRPVPAQVAALAVLPSGPAPDFLVYALKDGLVGVLDLGSGEPLWSEILLIDGSPCHAISLAPRGRELAMGTKEGQVLLWRWVD